MKYLLVNIIFIFIVFVNCTRHNQEEPEEKILVNIDNKATISVNEFIRRAEYVPRPDYIKQNSYIHKKIILNSLIAEKLLALQAAHSPLLQDEEFLGFLKGRKEQAMRQYMHNIEATSKVEMDTSEIKKAYKLAGREYEIAYYSVNDTSIVNQAIKNIEKDPIFFEGVFYQITGDTIIPTRKVSWNSNENLTVHKAIFSQEFKIGQVLPPIKLASNDYLFVKILGWSDEMAITEQQQNERYDKVTEKLTQIKSTEIWDNRVGEIMRGKRLDFNPEVFEQLSKLFFSVYFRTDKEFEEDVINQLWREEEEKVQNAILDVGGDQFMQLVFFTVDSKIWTVADFRRELISHPLVFRKRRMNADEFPEQFRFAVADFVRDYYVTQEAYKHGYDKVNIVERNANMWRDTFLALNQQREYLRSIGETRNFAKNYHAIIAEKLNPYIDQLQKRYYKKIELDFDEFENIALSSIDLFVKQSDMPFQYVVPLFPVITNDHMIEYVTKMNKSK